MDQGRPAAVLALDMVDAFDSVWHAALVETIRAMGLVDILLELLRDYLRECYMRVLHN